MTYDQAMSDAKTSGASRACREGFLAQTCKTLAAVHAVNPELLYGAANRQGMTGLELARLAESDAATFAFLQFE